MKQFTVKTFLIITFFLAATALALSIKVFSPAAPVAAPTALQENIQALEERIDQLTAALENSRQQGDAGPAPADPESGPVAALSSSELEPTTEARLQELSESMDDVRWTMALRGMTPPSREHIERARGLLADPGVDLSTKLAGLRLLRRSDELTDDDVRQMVALFHQIDDPRAQSAIIRSLDNVRTPEFLDTLMHVSSTSPNARLREEAVDSLSGYLPDPDLRDWLEIVARDDPDGRVKREASRLLSRYWPSGD